MGEFQGENHFCPKRRQKLVSHLSKNIVFIPKTFGKNSEVRLVDRHATHYIWHKTKTAFHKKKRLFNVLKGSEIKQDFRLI